MRMKRKILNAALHLLALSLYLLSGCCESNSYTASIDSPSFHSILALAGLIRDQNDLFSIHPSLSEPIETHTAEELEIKIYKYTENNKFTVYIENREPSNGVERLSIQIREKDSDDCFIIDVNQPSVLFKLDGDRKLVKNFKEVFDCFDRIAYLPKADTNEITLTAIFLPWGGR